MLRSGTPIVKVPPVEQRKYLNILEDTHIGLLFPIDEF
jgi:hypothetical protein